MHQNSKKEIPKTTQVSNWIIWSNSFHDLVLEHFWRGGCFFLLHQLLHPHLDSMIHEELSVNVRRHLKVGLIWKVIYCEYCRCKRCESCRDRIECWAIGCNGDGSVLTILQLWSSLNLHVLLMNGERRHTHTHSLSLSLLFFWWKARNRYLNHPTISLSLSFDPLTILLF